MYMTKNKVYKFCKLLMFDIIINIQSIYLDECFYVQYAEVKRVRLFDLNNNT